MKYELFKKAYDTMRKQADWADDQAVKILANMGGDSWIDNMNADTEAAKSGDVEAKRRLDKEYAKMKKSIEQVRMQGTANGDTGNSTLGQKLKSYLASPGMQAAAPMLGAGLGLSAVMLLALAIDRSKGTRPIHK